MKTLLGLLLFALFVCALAQRHPEIDAQCMNCICQASSNCDENRGCFNGGGGYYCGPYVISWAYWYDGGQPENRGGSKDFETCLKKKSCSEQAVRGYMRRYGKDCDGNGVIDCYDFARIHKLGIQNCGGKSIYDTDYWKKLEDCYPNTDHNVYNNGSPLDTVNINNNFVADYDEDYDYGEGSIQARRLGRRRGSRTGRRRGRK